MRYSSLLLLATAAIAVSLPYRDDESLFDIQPSQDDFLASNDWYLEDELTDNPVQSTMISLTILFPPTTISRSLFSLVGISQPNPPAKAKDPCNKPSTCDQLLKKFIKAVAPYKAKIPEDLQPAMPDSCHDLTQDYFRILQYFSSWSIIPLVDCDHDNDPTWLRIFWECQNVRTLSFTKSSSHHTTSLSTLQNSVNFFSD